MEFGWGWVILVLGFGLVNFFLNFGANSEDFVFELDFEFDIEPDFDLFEIFTTFLELGFVFDLDLDLFLKILEFFNSFL